MSSMIDVAPAVHAATIFLIRPLFLLGTYSNETILTLQTFLEAALSTSSHSVLSLSPTTLPPLPVYLACLKTSVSWTEWIRVLGVFAFDIVVEPEQVSVVRKDTAETGVLWRAPTAAEIPFASNRNAPRSAERKIPYADASQTTSTVLEIDSETDTESEASKLNDSRPSSRSSNHSRFSFSSRSSASSQSSVCSMADIPEPKAKFSVTTATTLTATPPTKYLYQGGISTVLTGGVMLGGKPTAPLPVLALATNNNPTARPPVYTPPHRAQRLSTSSRIQKRGAHTQTWRRGGASRTVA
ncbi:hypothetical protein Hypma_014385 [Hypsizygus marmoreus]|uniref:Uncharacterized protein n=1 Tax=Hypsizygus marmoreus TaxID=39966 RepID=A0A369JAT7_HYPMA|nr:hypothetical protein Hypma_014385 [Hypsizygus marmoreus]